MSNIIKVKISSPGKVILHGEHSVVYKKPALAAVVGVRTRLDLFEVCDSSVCVFHLNSLQCSFEIQISEINTFVESFIQQQGAAGLGKDLLLKRTREAVDAKFPDQSSVQVKTLHAIYYLLCGCLITSKNSALSSGSVLKISSELNIGAGLGSSASFGVCLATAFLILTKQISSQQYASEESLSLVSSWAFESERVMHGNPSGVDNTICTYGGIVRFTKGEPFSQIEVPKPLHVLLVDSKVSRSTAKLVEKVAILRIKFPKLIDLLWDSMEEVVEAATPIYQNLDDKENFGKLEELFRINNDLLSAIGVSHESLEKIFSIATRNKFSSKLTGAGGGGYAIILLPSDYKGRENYSVLCKELIAAGFGITETTVGGRGLIVEKDDF
ncbi:mevalonate kinase [Eupeodes corollae]|uniref:mevalonate kinase n=1 Tax=Eupeodes corollae TaxID=290404 RepID=UPI00248F648C|nr:mevalonate kinase [Eupeodes corollae]